MRTVRVTGGYGGRLTREARIYAGDYRDDDPLLYGLAEYLVQHGHAIFLEGDVQELPAPPTTTDEAWMTVDAPELDREATDAPETRKRGKK